MSVTNDFLPFCPTDTGTNLEEQSDYAVDPDRTIGNQPGVASSQLVNKALRQGTFIASQVGQFVANQTQTNVVDNAVTAQLLSQIQSTFQFLPPVFTSFLSGSTNFNNTYYFFVASANATAGATYTNNTYTYTVTSTISSGVILQATGTGYPTTSGTLTKASGTGDATISFYAIRSSLFIEVEGCGGGGGGGSSQGGTPGNGSNGSPTSFGGTLLVADGGLGGVYAGPGGAGGAAIVNTGAVGKAIYGGDGQAALDVSSGGTVYCPGGLGGSNPFGGAGMGGMLNGNNYGSPGKANTGGGGGGGYFTSTTSNSGAGGGAGGYFYGIIQAPTAPYAVVVGAGGAGNSSGTNAGGNGGSGVVYVYEKFQ